MPTSRQAAAAEFDVASYLQTKTTNAKQDTLNFFGVTIPVPTDTPLGVTLQAQEAQRNPEEASEKNVLELLSGILGDEVAEQIKDADAGVRACGALLLWSYRNAGGEPTTFPEAFEEYEENERRSREESESGEQEGKAPTLPNRETRRAAARGTQNGKKSGNTSR